MRGRAPAPGSVRRLVVKVGTSTICGENGAISDAYIHNLAREIVSLKARGIQVALVSSGAITAGSGRLGRARPTTIPGKQAMAAIGQGLLMAIYAAAFDAAGSVAAQVLLTGGDIADRSRYTNAANTFRELFQLGATPIVNENDTVAVEEIRFGDNDTLAALVSFLTDADLTLLLSDVAGLYNPSDPDRSTISVVTAVDPGIEAIARPASSATGTGGMQTKIAAARSLTLAGIPMVIAAGNEQGVVSASVARWEAALSGAPDPGRPGTLFLPAPRRLAGRKRWLAFGTRARGSVVVNACAAQALVMGGKSLLAAGVVDGSGGFEAGDPVQVLDEAGNVIGCGLIRVSDVELQIIGGRRSEDARALLGRNSSPEVIHRDDLVILVKETTGHGT